MEVSRSISNILIHLEKLPPDWLGGYDSNQFNHLTLALYDKFTQLTPTPKILLAEPDPYRFLASVVAAVAADCPLFLANPYWVEKEWQEALALVQPDLILGKRVEAVNGSEGGIPQIMIPTGGSSGKIRFAVHSWSSLTASVKGFIEYFPQTPVNSYCVLPLYHVSGLMQFLRSFLTGGKFLLKSYKELKAGETGTIDPQDFFISLVPTQLQYLLEMDSDWLSRFHTVLLGGAPPWRGLLDTARKAKIRLAPSYGMTETASMIVALPPDDFLAGNNSSGRVLPHGKVLAGNETGTIVIKTNSLCSGYYGEPVFSSSSFTTDDLGYFDSLGYLHVVGRNSDKIITGGENVFPSEVEGAILATGLVSDVCVVGKPDPKWGEVVTAFYVPKDTNISAFNLKILLKNKLVMYKIPQSWVQVDSLPRNEQGKINRYMLTSF
ncbi:MAG: 2-succinylbenzoate--CoA ligase [Prochloron sp. SP5CPC1]|nr:2-succinylbenzoate--CoA ligase [Candidatus Paraprochloron terpiosi SP5CPC1]